MIAAVASRLGVAAPVAQAAQRAWERAQTFSYPAQAFNKFRIVEAFMARGLSESDLAGSTGYGYDDAAREQYEALLCDVFGAQATLARLSIVSGTHAIAVALAACVAPGKVLLSATGRPYDTLRNVIVDAPFSLRSQGLHYREVPLAGRAFDTERVLLELQDPDVDAVFVQRSRGYATRPSMPVDACAELISQVKSVRPDVLVLVDNCYGELVEEREPTHAGADVIMGSLIKNIGGALAPAGGYIAGNADVLERVAARLYAPGLRSALGPTLGFGRAFLQGLFAAPLVVEQCLRGLDFSAALFAELGYDVDPQPGERRTDIVQAIRLGKQAAVLAFAAGLQRSMPINARFRPEPGPVPGYRDPVVMSSGAFVGGATIELSCDAPLREPYDVYLQGGVVTEHAVVGAMLAADAVLQTR